MHFDFGGKTARVFVKARYLKKIQTFSLKHDMSTLIFQLVLLLLTQTNILGEFCPIL